MTNPFIELDGYEQLDAPRRDWLETLPGWAVALALLGFAAAGLLGLWALIVVMFQLPLR